MRRRICAVPIRTGAPQTYVQSCGSKRPCDSYPVICCASAIAGHDRTRLSYVSAARTPFPRRRLAAGRDRLPWLWYRCDTVGQQVRISILAGHSRFARPAGFEPATRCLEGSCSVRPSYGRPETSVAGEDHASATYGSQCVATSAPTDSSVYEQPPAAATFPSSTLLTWPLSTSQHEPALPAPAGQCAWSSLARCSADSSRSTAARLSSSCATDEAPTSGITGTSPPISQASTTWLAVAPASAATERSAASRGAVPAWSNSAPSGR